MQYVIKNGAIIMTDQENWPSVLGRVVAMKDLQTYAHQRLSSTSSPSE